MFKYFVVSAVVSLVTWLALVKAYGASCPWPNVCHGRSVVTTCQYPNTCLSGR